MTKIKTALQSKSIVAQKDFKEKKKFVKRKEAHPTETATEIKLEQKFKPKLQKAARKKENKIAAGLPRKQLSDLPKTSVKLDVKPKEHAAAAFPAPKVTKYDAADAVRTIFVGNLPNNTKKVQLIKLFSQFGSVKSVRLRTANGLPIFKHKIRKASEQLTAYVVMSSDEATEKSVELNGTDFKGRHLRVNKADTKVDAENVDSKRIIFVGNLKYSASDEKLFDIFSSCGEIEYVRTLRNDKGCNGVAYVCFKKAEALNLALELNNTVLDERPIRVERYIKSKLGAKDKRTITSGEKEFTGAYRRLSVKNKNSGKIDNNVNKVAKIDAESTGKIKKSEYRGVKIGLKKKPKTKEKKKTNHLQAIAKKIAPKSLQ